MDTAFDYDLFVIGAGSAGVRAARTAARLGARVAVAEQSRLGGTCVNLGCVPKKLLVYASDFSRDFQDARGFGWTVGERRFDWPELIRRKDAELERLNRHYAKLLHGSGVEVLQGRAQLLGPNAVQLGAREIRARHLLVATGSRPRVPELRGAELGCVSDQMFGLAALPERALIVGGGYIAVEFAGILHGLGVEVRICHRGDQLLRGFDADVREFVTEAIRAQGIDISCGSELVAVERAGAGLSAHFASGAQLSTDLVLFATGRVPNTRGLGLEEVGVPLDPHGAIVVDAFGRTALPSVHAVGDVIDSLGLTPSAIAEGQAVAERLFGGRSEPADREGVPSAVFGHPEVAFVGLSEEQARARHGALRIFRARFRPMKTTLSDRPERGLMKLVVDAASDRVLGVHVVGPEASEIVQGFAVALKCGATKAQLDSTLGIHPTAAEELLTMRDPVSST
jgi:glutathione reductase (NADPH)